MSYSGRMQNSHYYSVFCAPRGRDRIYDLGMHIAQMYLSPFDKLIGIIGEAGSGKSMLIKGMFPGLELTNDDNGVNTRPLPILDIEQQGFFTAHTYHLDIRFEAAFTQMGVLADAILNAVQRGKRVIVEHFDIYHAVHVKNSAVVFVNFTHAYTFKPQHRILFKYAVEELYIFFKAYRKRNSAVIRGLSGHIITLSIMPF